MTSYDVFNGDADGICSLIQLRHVHPIESTLVTGIKRNINLLEDLLVENEDEVTVLDVSLDKNRVGLERILDKGANVLYLDHHYAGEIPTHPKLTTRIDTSADICTGLLMDDYLNGACRGWAVVAAFGDNLSNSAQARAAQLSLTDDQLQRLNKLGIYINYNGYGVTLDDLHFHPAALYKALSPYQSPLDFMADAPQTFEQLEVAYEEDMAKATMIQSEYEDDACAVFIFPDEVWARRVNGVYSNQLANDNPDRAHGVVTLLASGEYRISVRAPLNNKTGADEICRDFPTGGGRKAAAGINELPVDRLTDFIERLSKQYTRA